MIVEEIPAALAGERIDRIVALVTGASRSDATGLVPAGAVSVDGEVATSGKVRLREGQVVAIDETMLPVPARPVTDPTVEVRVVHVDDDHDVGLDTGGRRPIQVLHRLDAETPDHPLIDE